MNKEQVLGTTQTREFEIRAEPDSEERIIEVAFASEEPYERWWGVEVLEVSQDAMRLDRLKNNAPVQLDHSSSVRDTIGVVEDVRIDTDKIARARVRLSDREDVTPIYDDIQAGIVRKVSVGYRVHSMKLIESTDDEDIYRVDDYEPFEISIVGISAADATTGVGRSDDDQEQKVMTKEVEKIVDDEPKIMRLAAHLAGRVPGIEEQAKDFVEFGKTFAEFRDLAWKMLAEAQKKIPAEPVASEIGMTPDETRRYSLFRAVRAQLTGNWKGAELERDASIAIAQRVGKEPKGFFVPAEVQRAMSAGGVGTGAELVGTDHLGDQWIDALRTRSVVLGAGATVLENLRGNLDIPKLAGSATFGWIAEGADSGENDPATATVALSPKTIAGSVPMTRRLLLQSDPSSEMVIRNDMLNGAALAIDLAAIEGTGAANQPTGVVNQADVVAVTLATPGQPTWGEVVSFETALDNADTLMGSLAYVTTPAIVGHLKTTPKDSGSGIFLMEGMQSNGYEVRRRTGLTGNRMVFGDWSQVLVGFWGILDVVTDTAKLAASGGVVLRVFQDADIAVRHGQAFGNANIV